MISERQEKLLHFVVREYISSAEPVGSELLKKASKLDVSPATIRNDLQELTRAGYIAQPHTSAGRVPTKKAYQHFAEKVFIEEESFSRFIFEEIEKARQEIEAELKMADELRRSLEKISTTLSISYIREIDDLSAILHLLGPSKMRCERNISIITQIIKELEQL